MKHIEDGGPAFPSDGYSHGMSLRDWFAGQALAGLYAGRKIGHIDRHPDAIASYAEAAFSIADAMLEARTK